MAYPQGPPPGAYPQGPPPGAYPQGPYPPPGGYAVDHPQGTIVLVLGIVSIVACQLTGPFAWAMGRRVLEEMDAQPGRYANRGLVQAGYICGIIGSVLLGIVVAVFVVYFLIIIVFVGAAASAA